MGWYVGLWGVWALGLALLAVMAGAGLVVALAGCLAGLGLMGMVLAEGGR